MGKFYEYEKPNETLNGNERTVIEKEGVTYSVMLKEIVEGLIQGVYLQDLLSEEIETLENVTIENPTNYQVLSYLDGYWVNGSVGVAGIDDIGDVTISGGVTNGHVLTYNNGVWGNAAPITSVAALSDVTLSTPVHGQALTYYKPTEQDPGVWVNSTPASTLSGLDDVTITDVAGTHYLAWNGTDAWENVAPIFHAGNTSFSQLNNDQVLKFSNGNWINSTLNLTTTLAALTDVDLDGDPLPLANGHVLSYDSIAQKWTNAVVSSGSPIVVSSTPPSNPVNGTLWVDTGA